MSITQFVILLFVGAIAGWVACRLVKWKGFGLLGNMAVGVAGSFLGAYLLKFIGVYANGPIESFVVATLGAVVLLILIKAIKKI